MPRNFTRQMNTESSRRNYSSGAPWESVGGYSRAVRIGSLIEVSGTVAVDAQGLPYRPGDPGAQAERIFEIILESLAALGAGPEHVIRTRMYVTDIRHWESVARAHGKCFGDTRPATTLVEVSALIAPGFQVEIEATACIPQTP